MVYGLSWFTDEELVPHIPTLFSVIYGSFHRFAWGLALAWIIFACVHGFGGNREDLEQSDMVEKPPNNVCNVGMCFRPD